MNRSDRSTLLMITTVILIAGITIALGRPFAAADSIVLLQTNGMTCGSCSGKITDLLKQVSGVAEVAVDVQAAIVEVQFDAAKTSPLILATRVNSLGYPSTVAYVQKMKNNPRNNNGTPGCSPGGCGNCDKRK